MEILAKDRMYHTQCYYSYIAEKYLPKKDTFYVKINKTNEYNKILRPHWMSIVTHNWPIIPNACLRWDPSCTAAQ